MASEICISDLSCFARMGRMFAIMTGYLDDNTVACGGWIADGEAWANIQRRWLERIAYENRIQLLKGLKPIKRYHASDCANCVNDFEGWDVPRQIRFTRRLLDIMASPPLTKRPMAFAFAVPLSELRSVAPETPQTLLLRDAYSVAASRCLRDIGEVMRDYYSDERITCFHDSGKMFDAALLAFRHEQKTCGQFISFAPIDWQDCPLLQPADMVAFDAFKVTNQRLHGNPDFQRRSLESLVARTNPIFLGHFKPGVIAKDYGRWLQSRKEAESEAEDDEEV